MPNSMLARFHELATVAAPPPFAHRHNLSPPDSSVSGHHHCSRTPRAAQFHDHHRGHLYATRSRDLATFTNLPLLLLSRRFPGFVRVAKHQEANPGVCLLSSSPFLFAIVFGDWEHGICLLLGSHFIIREKKLPGRA